jgi:hypothetical protein
MPVDISGIDFSLSAILSSLLFGVIGMWMFREGKRNTNLKIVAISVLLMIYPYFTHGPVGDWGVGIILCGLAHHFWYE